MAWLQTEIRLAPRRRGFHLITPEIEAAVELLPSVEKQELLRYLERHLNEPAPGRRALPLVPASGQRITQQEIDDALEAD